MSKSRDIADSAATINFIDGLTSDAQTQIDTKAPLASPTFTGTVTATAFSGDGSALTGVDSLPSQTGNNGLFLTTDGSTASWAEAGGGGAWEYISAITASGASEIDVEWTYGSHEAYMIILNDYMPSNDQQVLSAYLKLNGTYQNSGYYYHFANTYSGSGTYIGYNGNNANNITISQYQSNNSNFPSAARIIIYNANQNTAYNQFFVEATSSYVTGGSLNQFWNAIGQGSCTANKGVSGLRFSPASGTASGTAYLYGLKISQEKIMTYYRATVHGNIPFTAEEAAEKNQRDAEYLASANDRTASKIRTERDTKLTESDWTQVIDAPVDQAAWATYRQELRDISTQVGFPSEVTWPTQP